MYRKKNVNILHRLRDRQLSTGPPGTAVNNIRWLYECIYPNKAVCALEDCQIHVCKFTPCGRYLVAFDALQHSLLLYRFKGPDASYKGEAPPVSEWPGRSQPMSTFFELMHCQLLAAGTELLCKDFCLVFHDRYLVLASATPPAEVPRPFTRADAEAGVEAMPRVAATTFHLVSIEQGIKLDVYSVYNDLVNLSMQAGCAVYGDCVAILGVRSQTLHMLQVLPSGKFVSLLTIGEQCFVDDALALATMQDREARWGRQRQQQREAIARSSLFTQYLEDQGGGLPYPQTAPPPPQLQAAAQGPVPAPPRPPLQHAAAAGPARPLPSREARRGQLQESAARPQEPARQLQGAGGRPQARVAQGRDEAPGRAGNGEGDRGGMEASTPGPSEQGLAGAAPVTGFKQRLLAYLYRGALAGGRQALQRFYYQWDKCLKLLMLKVQFLDADHLLISLGNVQHWLSRNNDTIPNCDCYVVYCWNIAQVVRVYQTADSSEEALVQQYLRYPAHFYPDLGGPPWARFVTPFCCGRHACERTLRQLNYEDWSRSQVVRHVTAVLPTGSQAFCANPYLDTSLFQYDDRLISPQAKPRLFTDQPIKFVSRRHPDRLKFVIDVASACRATTDTRMPKHLRFLMHPVQPFMLLLLQGHGVPKAVLAMFYV